MLWRDPGIREAVFESQFIEPDRTTLTEELKKRLIQQVWYGDLVACQSGCAYLAVMAELSWVAPTAFLQELRLPPQEGVPRLVL